jgi:hypothetical protein
MEAFKNRVGQLGYDVIDMKYDVVQEYFISENKIVTALIIGFVVGLVNVALGNILRESSYLFNVQLLFVGVGVVGIVYLSSIFMIPSIHGVKNQPSLVNESI